MFYTLEAKPNRLFIGGLALFFLFCTVTFLPAETASSSLPFKPISAFNSFKIETSMGQAGYPIPIEVPPGVRGLQPDIRVDYSSNNPNGYLGMGWSLNLGYIERSTRLGAPKYDVTDTFYISFREFRFELEINPERNTYWLKETPSYLKLVFDGSGWKAFDSRGNTYYFGQAEQSRISGAKGTFRWLLNRIVDSCGNYIVIVYEKDRCGVYPLRIEYTGNESSRTLPVNSVNFIWENRNDAIYDFHGGMPIATEKRLRHIETKAGRQLVRRYAFEYKYSAATRRSLLSTVTTFGNDGAACFPPVKFFYQEEKPEYVFHVNSSPKGNVQWQIGGSDINENTGGAVYPDGRIPDTNNSIGWGGYTGVNGEGRWTWGDGSSGLMIIDSKGSLSFDMRPNFALRFSTYLYVNEEKTVVIPATGNCNAKYFLNVDYEHPYDFSTPVRLNKGYNLFEITGYNTTERSTFNLNFPVTDNVDAMNSFQMAVPLFSGDFNGDGKSDLGEFGAGRQWYIQLSAGDKFLPKTNWGSIGLSPGGGTIPFLGNFNGDAKTDVGFFSPGGDNWWNITKSRGTHLGGGGGLISVRGSSRDDLPAVADFNADGKTELGYYRKTNGNWYIELSRVIDVRLFIAGFGGAGWVMHLGDFNGDGLADAAVSNENGDWKIAFSDGASFIDQDLWLVNFGRDKSITIADFNSDGLSDVGYIDKESGRVIFRASTGRNFKEEDEVWIGGLDTAGQMDIALQVGDFNGDGILDPYIFNPASGYSVLGYSKGNFSDLLIKAENGLGSLISLTYAYSAGFDNKVYNSRGEVLLEGLPAVMPLVSKIEVSDGLGNSYATYYIYEGGFYDVGRRKFRGFRRIRETNNNGNTTDTHYHQDTELRWESPYQMRPYLIEKKDSSGRLCEKIENTWYHKFLGGPTGYRYGFGKFPYVLRRYKYTYDEDGISTRNITIYNYDDYGNFLCTVDPGVAGSNGDESISGLMYCYNNKSDGSVLSLPSAQAYTYFNDPLFSDSHITYTSYLPENYFLDLNRPTKWLFYDNNSAYDMPPVQGLLTKEVLAGDNTYSVNSPNNPVIAYSYDPYGNVISTTGPNAALTTTLYDSTHTFPIEITNALGHKTRMAYDPGTGRELVTIDANNQRTQNLYDALGRLVKVIGPNDSLDYPGTIYEYDFSRCPAKITEKKKIHNSPRSFNYPYYLITYYFYDGLNRLIQIKSLAENDPQGGRPRQVVSDVSAYDHRGQVKEKYLPYFTDFSDSYSLDFSDKPKFTFSYDPLGRLIQTINSDGTNSSRSYSVFTGRKVDEYAGWSKLYPTLIITKTDENGHRRRSMFDGLGRLIKEEEFNGTQIYETAYKYNLLNDLIEIKDAAGNITAIEYDPLHRKTSISDPDMGLWRYTYDKSGNLRTQTDAKSQTISFEYDALNRLTSKTNSTNVTIAAYHYDDAAKPYCIGRLSYVTDLSGRTDYYYDRLGRQVRVVKVIDSKRYGVRKQYDALDRIAVLTYPDNYTVEYEYNPQGIERVYNQPVQHILNEYVKDIDYSAAGQITNIRYGNNVLTEYVYDPLTSRLSDLQTNSGRLQNLRYQYDSTGNILRIADYRNSASQDFIYDDLNRLLQANGSYGNFGYGYDAIGNIVDKEGVHYSYGQDGRMPHALVSGADNSLFRYDANGNMAYRKTAGKEANITYDSENRPVEFASPSGRQNVQLKVGGNLLVIPVSALTPVEEALEPLKLGVDYSSVLRYNKHSLSWEEYSAQRKGFTDLEPQELVLIICLRDVLWRLEERITRFAYDAEGKRLKKEAGGVTTLYVGDLYEESRSLTGSLKVKHIFAGSQRIASVILRASVAEIPPEDSEGGSASREEIGETVGSSGRSDSVRLKAVAYSIPTSVTNTYYYHPDHLGSSNVITNSFGRQAQLIEYTPFGSLATNSVIASPEGAKQSRISHYYTGKELDASGLYYFGARYYDPDIGRFISPDNFVPRPYNPQYLNRYSYCLNNSLRYIDPTGNYSRSLNEYGSNAWFSDIAQSYNNSSLGGNSYLALGAMNSNYFNSLNNPFSSTSGLWSGGLFTAADFLPGARNYFANAQPFSPYAATSFAALGGFLEGISRFERFSRPGIFIVDRSNTIGWMGQVFQYERPWRIGGGIATALTVGMLTYDLGKTFTNPYLGLDRQIARASIQVIGAGVMWGVGYGVASTFNSTIPGVIISTALIAGADYLVNSIQNYLYGLWELG